MGFSFSPFAQLCSLAKTDTAAHAGCDWFRSHVALLQRILGVDIKTLKLVFDKNVTFEMSF
jgi:hypothetical protein